MLDGEVVAFVRNDDGSGMLVTVVFTVGYAVVVGAGPPPISVE